MACSRNKIGVSMMTFPRNLHDDGSIDEGRWIFCLLSSWERREGQMRIILEGDGNGTTMSHNSAFAGYQPAQYVGCSRMERLGNLS